MKENTFYQNLFAAKKEIGKISKDSTNPFFKSKYFDINALLEHVEPVLAAHGLFILQPLNDDSVSTMIFDENGFSVESKLKLPQMTDPQRIGACVTYFRRFTLASLLSLQAEDDDGNHAAKKPQAPKRLNAEQLKATLSSTDIDKIKNVYDTFVLTDDEKKKIFKRIAELTAK